MKTLVAYFNASGTTKNVASQLASTIDADLFAIEPTTPYTAADLNWNDQNSRSSIEMKDPTSRPTIATKVENMAEYDKIYLGFPIWW